MKYTTIEESKKEFYFYIGLLSTKFAKAEVNLLSILGLLVVDNFVVTTTILERNSLAQNLELLKKLNKYRNYEEIAIKNICDKLSNIKGKRNLFIHGIWGEPFEFENDLIIQCYEPKLLFEEGEISKTWTSIITHEFKLTYIKNLVEDIEDIIVEQDRIIMKLTNHEFN